MLITFERLARQRRPAGPGLLPPDGLLSAIVLAEFRVGLVAAVSEGQRRNAAAFLTALERHMPLVPFGRREAASWAVLFVELRRSGTSIGERDLQIAATAVAGGHTVMTDNVRDFSRVPNLTVLPSPFV